MRRLASTSLVLTTLFLIALTIIATQAVQAQTFTVIHNFTGGQDGGDPLAGLTMDKEGNLYGTTTSGGNKGGNCFSFGCGTVFKLTRKSAQWVFTPLYSFQSGNDGTAPEAPVTIGRDGTLYGTTSSGGNTGGGTVYNLRPKPGVCKSALCPWVETLLYNFKNDCCSGDGIFPWAGVVLDQAGNLYGTTTLGGGHGGAGAVYEVAPSGVGWTETVLHGFGLPDGTSPYAGLIFDKAGNLLGTTFLGGSFGYGTVYELMPSGSGWTEHILYSFQETSDGGYPYAGLIFDQAGNLFGATSAGGLYAGGTVFELIPSNGNWALETLYALPAFQGPYSSLVMDAAGNLYGARTGNAGYEDYGSVFKLTPGSGGWTYTDLHDFTGDSDGANPYGGPVLDANGTLYGTTQGGGAYGYGVVFEITP